MQSNLLKIGSGVILFLVFLSGVIWADQNTSVQSIPLRAALDSLSQKYNLCFIYDDEIVQDKMVTWDIIHDDPDAYVEQIIRPFQVSLKKVTDVTFILYLNKQRTVYGHVFDAQRNIPLVGANVFVQGTPVGMETGKTGTFRLVIPIDTELLTVRYMGYETQRVHLLQSPDGLHVPMNPIVIPMQAVEAVARIDHNLNQRPGEEFRSNQRVVANGLTPGIHAQMSDQLPEVDHIIDVYKDPKGDEVVLKEYDKIIYSPMLEQGADVMMKLVKPGQINENLTLIGGLRFYETMHASGIPGSGAYIYSHEMMSNSRYYCGGFQVNHGDATGTVHDIQYQKGLKNSFAGKLSFHSYGQALFLVGGDSSRFSVMAHAKRYDRKLLPSPSYSNRKMFPQSQDIQTQFYYQLTDHHRLNGYVLFSMDRCKYSPVFQNSQSQTIQLIDNQEMICNNAIESKYSNRFVYSTSIVSMGSAFLDDDKRSNIQISYYSNRWTDKLQSEYAISSDFPEEALFTSEYDSENHATLNLDERIFETDFRFEMNVSETWQRQSGFLYRYFQCRRNYQWFQPTTWETNVPVENYYGNFNENHFLTTYYFSDDGETKEDIQGAKLCGYFLEEIHFLDKYIFTAGIRINVNTLNQSTSVDPRMRLGYMPDERFLFQFTWGIYSEMPVLYAMDWTNNSSGKYANQRAMHSVLSVDIQAASGLSLLFEGYYKWLREFIPVQRNGDGVLTFLIDSKRRKGNTFGLRTGVTFSKSVFHLESLYELRTSQEFIPELSKYYPRFDDQRHSLSSIFSVDIHKSFVVKLVTNVSSGYAYAPYVLSENNTWIPSEMHKKRFPAFSRFDVVLEKTFNLRRGEIRLNLQCINLLNRKNIYGYHYTFDQQQNPLKTSQMLYGFLPLFGVDYIF